MLYSPWMRKTATPIVLSEAEQETLQSWLRAGTSEQRMVERARIILAAAEGVGQDDPRSLDHPLLARPGPQPGLERLLLSLRQHDWGGGLAHPWRVQHDALLC